MQFLRRNLKRILTDAAGYGLILLGIATGWLPGPGGIPLIVAGLGLLSINNEWAARLRAYTLEHGGKFVKAIFPTNRFIQALYDFATLLLLVLVAVLAWSHSRIWQISLAIALFFIALFIAAMNRDRLRRLKRKQ
jgi:hypothetical protein